MPRWVVIVVAVALVLGLAAYAVRPGSAARGISEHNAVRAPVLAPTARSVRILVIGGTSGVGLATVALALERGHTVTAMARHAPTVRIASERWRFLKGDITDAAAVAAAVRDQDVVVTSISLPPTRREVRVFSVGMHNVLAAMKASGVRNLIAVTGVGAGDSRGHGGFLYDWVGRPLILSTIYDDKDREEAEIRASAVHWLIVRPSTLSNGLAGHHYWIVHDLGGVSGGAIARADVAHFIISAAESMPAGNETLFLTN